MHKTQNTRGTKEHGQNTKKPKTKTQNKQNKQINNHTHIKHNNTKQK